MHPSPKREFSKLMAGTDGFRTQLSRFLNDSGFAAKLARGGVLAITIRIASIGASYLMFVVLARAMDTAAYGRFAFAFSLATFVSVVAGLGQRLLVLRFVPLYEVDKKPLLVQGLIRDSYGAVILGSAVCALAMIMAAYVWGAITQENLSYLFAGALLMIAISLADHQQHVMRAFGRIGLALIPQDIVWRAVVIIVAGIAVAANRGWNASDALNVCSVTLLLIVAGQALMHPETRPGSLLRRALETERERWRSESLGLWGSTVVGAAAPNLSVVLLGLTLSPAETGPFFAAMKTASLLKLPLTAGTIVGAPLISRYYGAGRIDDVQKISNYMVIGLTVPVVAAFLAILIFGHHILAFFGPDFTSARLALVIISFGVLVNALCGPTGFLMNMTGHHREFLSILSVTQVVALAVLPFAALMFGMVGAATAVALGRASWNLWVWRWSRRKLSIDPTLFGVAEWLALRRATER